MKLYKRLVKPIIVSPNHYMGFEKEDVESGDIWYEEELIPELREKFSNDERICEPYNYFSFRDKYVEVEKSTDCAYDCGYIEATQEYKSKIKSAMKEIYTLSPTLTAEDLLDGNPVKDAVWEILVEVKKILKRNIGDMEQS